MHVRMINGALLIAVVCTSPVQGTALTADDLKTSFESTLTDLRAGAFGYSCDVESSTVVNGATVIERFPDGTVSFRDPRTVIGNTTESAVVTGGVEAQGSVFTRSSLHIDAKISRLFRRVDTKPKNKRVGTVSFYTDGSTSQYLYDNPQSGTKEGSITTGSRTQPWTPNLFACYELRSVENLRPEMNEGSRITWKADLGDKGKRSYVTDSAVGNAIVEWRLEASGRGIREGSFDKFVKVGNNYLPTVSQETRYGSNGSLERITSSRFSKIEPLSTPSADQWRIQFPSDANMKPELRRSVLFPAASQE